MNSSNEEPRLKITVPKSGANTRPDSNSTTVPTSIPAPVDDQSSDIAGPTPANPKSKAVRMSPVDWASFPDQPTGGGSPPMTIANLRHLLAAVGITVRYNVIKKKFEIIIPGHVGTDENADNVALAHVTSLVAKCGLSTGQIANYIAALGDENAYNPVGDWIDSKRWDGEDRLPEFSATLTDDPDFPTDLKYILIRKWLLSCTAAALMPKGFRSRGVLTLQGAQGIGKTQWVASLVPPGPLRNSVIKLDHHLDAYNKDSIIGATTHWVCEIGELDSSMKKDVARIKGVLTRDYDKVRIPYAVNPSEFPRRTVFVATVNQSQFLVDDTGNSRFWTIPVTDIDFAHTIDTQQLFAQLAVEFRAGAQWWLDLEEEALLEEQNRHHRTTSAIADRLMSLIDLGRPSEPALQARTPTELLIELGYTHPTNPQMKECAAFLRERFGESKRIQGQNKWRVALKGDRSSQFREKDQDPDFDPFA